MARNANKTEAIKIRVEPLSKLTLEQIASEDELDVSDIVRQAIREYIVRRQPRHSSDFANA